MDHLFSPGGLVGARSMYAAHVAWWFSDASNWAIDELVTIERLSGLGVPRVRVGEVDAGDAYNAGWILEDVRLYCRARGELVRFESRAADYIAAATNRRADHD